MESEELGNGVEDDVEITISVEGGNTSQVMEIFRELDSKVEEVL